MTDQPPSNPFTDIHAYRPARLPDDASRRSGGLTAICIIAIVLAVLGILSGGAKGLNVVFGAQIQQAFGGMGAVTEQQAQAQQEMQAAVAAEMNRFRVINGILSVTQVMLCGMLVYGGVRALALRRLGRKVLLACCVCLLVYEVAQSIALVFQQLSMGRIMETYMPRMMQDPFGNNEGAEQFGQLIARMSIIVGAAVQCVWTLVKLIFYTFAIHYLCRDKVAALFGPNTTRPAIDAELA